MVVSTPHSFCGSGIQEQLGWALLASGFSGGCSRCWRDLQGPEGWAAAAESTGKAALSHGSLPWALAVEGKSQFLSMWVSAELLGWPHGMAAVAPTQGNGRGGTRGERDREGGGGGGERDTGCIIFMTYSHLLVGTSH